VLNKFSSDKYTSVGDQDLEISSYEEQMMYTLTDEELKQANKELEVYKNSNGYIQDLSIDYDKCPTCLMGLDRTLTKFIKNISQFLEEYEELEIR